MTKQINVALVELGSSDEITIVLLGTTPPGIPARHVFTGQGLQQIDTIMLDLGIHVVAWMVNELPWQGETDLPLIKWREPVTLLKAGAK